MHAASLYTEMFIGGGEEQTIKVRLILIGLKTMTTDIINFVCDIFKYFNSDLIKIWDKMQWKRDYWINLFLIPN